MKEPIEVGDVIERWDATEFTKRTVIITEITGELVFGKSLFSAGTKGLLQTYDINTRVLSKREIIQRILERVYDDATEYPDYDYLAICAIHNLEDAGHHWREFNEIERSLNKSLEGDGEEAIIQRAQYYVNYD